MADAEGGDGKYGDFIASDADVIFRRRVDIVSGMSLKKAGDRPTPCEDALGTGEGWPR